MGGCTSKQSTAKGEDPSGVILTIEKPDSAPDVEELLRGKFVLSDGPGKMTILTDEDIKQAQPIFDLCGVTSHNDKQKVLTLRSDYELTEEDFKAMKEMFDKCDTNHDGEIDTQGLKKSIIYACASELDNSGDADRRANVWTDDRLRSLADDKESIKFTEFVSIMQHQRPVFHSIRQLDRFMLKHLEEGFRSADENNDGKIDVNDLKKVMKGLSMMGSMGLPFVGNTEFLNTIDPEQLMPVDSYNLKIGNHKTAEFPEFIHIMNNLPKGRVDMQEQIVMADHFAENGVIDLAHLCRNMNNSRGPDGKTTKEQVSYEEYASEFQNVSDDFKISREDFIKSMVEWDSCHDSYELWHATANMWPLRFSPKRSRVDT